MSLKNLLLLTVPLICLADTEEPDSTSSPPSATIYTPPTRLKKSELSQLLIPDLKGIVLLPSKECLLKGEELKNIEGLEVGNIDFPGPPTHLEMDLQPFIGEPLTLKGVYDIKNVIGKFYEKNYHPLILIEVPTQDISYGVLQLVLTESRLGEIKVEGNQKWSNLDRVKSLIELKPNEYINDRILTKDLNFLNRSSYRQVDAIYEPGVEEGTTDLLLLVQDIKPYQFYVGTDNTGIEDTLSNLVYAGFTTGNCFGQGHTLTYQYTTSNFHRMQAHTVQYLAPLPNLHTINVFGGYASVFPKQNIVTTNNSGYAIQASLRYLVPLLPTLNLRHDVTAGFDYKRTNTDLLFTSDSALAPFNQSVNLTELMFGYNGTYKDPNFVLVYIGEIYFSPLQWLAQQSDFDFSQLRPGAKNKWVYAKGAVVYYQKLPYDCYLNLSVRGQTSSTALLPSEQFGLGGYETVRGYHERVLNYDSGVLLSAEFHTPTWKITHRIKKSSSLSDGLQLLAFVDYGWGTNHTPLPGEPDSDFLAGVGPGVRYFLESYLNCRFDYGIKLHRSSVIGTSFGYLHFSVVASY